MDVAIRNCLRMLCPVCHEILQNKEFETQSIDECPVCGGIWFDEGELHEVASHLILDNKVNGLSIKESVNRKIILADKNNQPERKCPKCNIRMTVINYAYNSNVVLDRCVSCGGLWADKNEIEAVARIIKGNPAVDKYADALAGMTAEIEESKRVTEEITSLSSDLMRQGSIPLFAWPIIPLPLKDDLPTEKFSKVTFGLIVVNILIFIVQLALVSAKDESYFRLLGVVPFLGFSIDRWYSFFTSMFIHGGWLHVLGNMFYLWLFGNNIEDKIGSIKFIIFYLLCGILGGVVFCIMHHSLNEPGIGASGAISGILGAYLILFPKADLSVLWLGKIRTVPAIFYLLFWMFFQLIYGMVALGAKGVAIGYWAHIGGFIAGLSLIHFFKRKTG